MQKGTCCWETLLCSCPTRESTVPHDQSSVQNLILRSLSSAAFDALRPRLEPVSLTIGDPTEAPGELIDYAYFPETAMNSTVARTGPHDAAEVGICGRDGMVGIALALGASRGTFESFIQVPGEAFRISSKDLRAATAESSELKALLMLYAHTYTVQISYTALSNARHSVIERMSRWLLMCDDRVPSKTLELTHEFLSLMLGVRRAGITTDMHVLEGQHAVANRRGKIAIRDRAKLEEFAGTAYGDPEAEYEMLFGETLRRASVLEG